MIDIVRELHGLLPIVLENGKEVFDRVPLLETRKQWREGWKHSFLSAMLTAKHRDWRAGSFNFLIGIMKTSSYQYVFETNYYHVTHHYIVNPIKA